MERAEALLTPANVVTTVRAAGAVCCAGLVAWELSGRMPSAHRRWLPWVSAPTLLLDLVDGAVARRTDTVTVGGGRYDMEVDAAMVAILSARLVPTCPPALVVGSSRYLLAAGGALRPRWRRPVRPRPFRKRVAAGVATLLWVTTLPGSGRAVRCGAVLTALGLLSWSFGSQVLELERAAPEPREKLHGPL